METLLLVWVVFMALPVILHWFFRKHVSLVVFYMLAGFLCGKSYFGYYQPELFQWVFNPFTQNAIDALGMIVIGLFMFESGLEMDMKKILDNKKQLAATSIASFAFPFCATALLGLILYWFYPSIMVGSNANAITFAVAFGCSGAIVAMPVLSTIVKELKMGGIGKKALGIAAAKDIFLWVILTAVFTANPQINKHGHSVLFTVVMIGVYISVMVGIIRPSLVFIARNGFWAEHNLGGIQFVVGMILAVLSAKTTDYIGLHEVIGYFFMGVIFPKEHQFQQDGHTITHTIAEKYEKVFDSPLVKYALMPFFFVKAGLGAEFELQSSMILIFVALFLCASVPKALGVIIPERKAKTSWKQTLELATLQQAGGALEIILAGIFLSAGVYTSQSFSLMFGLSMVSTALVAVGIKSIRRFVH